MNLVPRVLTCLTFVIFLFVSGCEAFDKNGNEAVYPGPDAGVDVGPLTEWACSDGLDDDGDGLTDCADPDCTGSGYCTNPDTLKEGACNDGVDNEGDGLID